MWLQSTSSRPSRRASHGAGHGLHRERDEDRERDDAREQVAVGHRERGEHADERGGHDPGLARPAHEGQLGAAPAAAAVREHADRDRHRARDEQQHGHHGQGRQDLLPQRVEGQVGAHEHEHEDGHDVGEAARGDHEVAAVLVVHRESEHPHVAHDQPGEEGTQVTAAAGEVQRDVGHRDDGEHRDGRGLAPDPRAAARDGRRQHDAGEHAARAAQGQLTEEVAGRSGQRVLPREQRPGDGQRQHRAGRVVEGRLGHHRLSHLRPQPRPDEERNEDGRIGGGEHRADEQALLEGQAEDERRRGAGDDGGDDDAEHGEQAEAQPDLAQDLQRQVQPAVEEDRRDAEGEHELGAERVQRDVEHVQRRGPQERPDAQQEHDLGDAQQRGQQAGQEAGHEQQAQRQDDVARHGSRLACCSSASRATSHAVSSSRMISTPAPRPTTTRVFFASLRR